MKNKKVRALVGALAVATTVNTMPLPVMADQVQTEDSQMQDSGEGSNVDNETEKDNDNVSDNSNSDLDKTTDTNGTSSQENSDSESNSSEEEDNGSDEGSENKDNSKDDSSKGNEDNSDIKGDSNSDGSDSSKKDGESTTTPTREITDADVNISTSIGGNGRIKGDKILYTKGLQGELLNEISITEDLTIVSYTLQLSDGTKIDLSANSSVDLSVLKGKTLENAQYEVTLKETNGQAQKTLSIPLASDVQYPVEEYSLTADDINISTSLTDDTIVVHDGVLYCKGYIRGIGLNMQAQSLVDGVSIEKCGIEFQEWDGNYTRCVLEDNGVVHIFGKDGKVADNYKEVKYFYELSNGQTITSDAKTTFYDLTGIEELKDLREITFDTTPPVISKVSDTTKTKEYNGTSYVVKDGVITVKATKDTGVVPSIVSVVNEQGTSVDYDTNDDGSISINTTQFVSGSTQKLTVTATDELGLTSSETYTYNFQKSAPVITGLSHSKVNNKNGMSYSNKGIDLYIGVPENDKAISSIELLRDGDKVASFVDGHLAVSESGTYSIRVTDIVGNTTDYNLSDLYSDLNNTLVLDTLSPTVNISLNDSLVSDDWITKEGRLKLSLEDNEELADVTVTVNGVKQDYNFASEKNHELTYNLATDFKRDPKGIYNVEVTVTDYVGNFTTINKTIHADFDSPTKGTLSASGDFVETNGKLYVQGTINIKGTPSDIGSGIDRVELLRDGKVVDSNKDFVIADEGTYSIKIIDKAGLLTEYSLAELLGTKSSTICIDNEAPVIDNVAGFKPDVTKDGINWYKNAPILTYKVTDKYIKYVSIKVNGDEKVSTLSEDGVYTINTSAYTDGKVSVSVVAVDYYGHTTKSSFDYTLDTLAPTFTSARLSEPYVVRGGVAFFKHTPTLVVKADDKAGIGVNSYVLSGSKSEVNSSGSFVLGTGSYEVEVKDILGNSVKKPISDLIPELSTNSFIVDSSVPTISASLPEGSVNSWYSKDISFDASLSDDIGIKEAHVYINGVLTNTYISNNIDVKSAKINIDSSKVKADSKGFYQVLVDITDNAGNTNSWTTSFYEDKSAPTVDRFEFTGDGYQESEALNGSDRYGFFFKGSANCTIYVSDGDVSSGLKNVIVTLQEDSGKITRSTLAVKNGTVSFKLPEDFKGFVSAYAVDNVGNQGKTVTPNGVIAESSNCFINNLNLNIDLPTTDYKDLAGLPLYSSDISATATIGCKFAGIKSVEWGIDGTTLGTVNVDTNGKITGDTVSVKESGKNLVLSLSDAIALKGNANALTVWVKVIDKTGQTSQTEKKFSIDKDKPVINVSYDNSEGDGYYNKTRTANIVVEERNFDPTLFKVSGKAGFLGTWSHSDGDRWVNSITFSEDEQYQYSLDCTDRAGNVGSTYSSEQFYIDKTAPTMSVSFDNNNSANGNFYNQNRTATVTVVDKNFDPSLFKLQGSGSLGGWSTNGDTHIASVTFNEDGDYEFSISGQDKASNLSETFSSGKFILDKTAPTLDITGVENAVSYKKDVGLTVKLADTHIDTSKTSVSLRGKRNGELRVTGSLNETTGEYTFTSFPKEESYDDIYTLSAVVVDKAGNEVNKNIVFSVNRFGSVYTFMDSSLLGNYLNKARDIQITESNVDRLDTEKARVSVILDGKEVDVDSSNIDIKESEGDDGKYNYLYTVKKEAFNTDGKYLIQIYSHAEEGTDYSSVSEEYAFVLDTTDPEIIVSGVESGKKYHEYSRKVSIDVRDLSGVGEIKVTLNGNNVPLTKSDGIYTFEINESSGSQNLEVAVTDLAGNVSVKTIDNFVITSNMWVFIINQLWFKVGVGAVIVFLTALVGVLVRSRRKARKEESALLEEHAQLINESISSSQVSTGEKDEVEDLEHPSK